MKNSGGLLVNAVYWTLGLEKKIKANAKLDRVGAYQPTPFKFGGFVKGGSPRTSPRASRLRKCSGGLSPAACRTGSGTLSP